MFDNLTRDTFLSGYCHALALALHRKYGLELVALIGEVGGEEIIVHVACEYPGDWMMIVDVEGVRSRKGAEDVWFEVDGPYWEDVTEEWIGQAIEDGQLLELNKEILARAENVADRLVSALQIAVRRQRNQMSI